MAKEACYDTTDLIEFLDTLDWQKIISAENVDFVNDRSWLDNSYMKKIRKQENAFKKWCLCI